MPLTAAVSSSSLVTPARNRENAQLPGTPSRAGLGRLTAMAPPLRDRPTDRFGGPRRGSGSKPHRSSSAGLRRSSRSRDSTEACWNTTPATSARHIASTG